MKTRVKEALKAILPPAAFKCMRWISYKIHVTRLRGFEGYMDHALVNLVINKTAKFRQEIEHNKQIDINSTRLILPFAFLPEVKTYNVLDFGGGAGIHYEVAKLSFPNQQFHWVIVESLHFVQSGNSQISPEKVFRQSISEAISSSPHFDLVVASSSLQYTENPISHLQELCAIGAPYLYITRQILSETQKFLVFNQVTKLGDHGPGQVPSDFSNRKTIHKLIAAPVELFEETLERNYSILLRIKEEQNVHEFSGHQLNYFGYMCKLRS
jgi:putative methyltransferase (TIGR04325 family)